MAVQAQFVDNAGFVISRRDTGQQPVVTRVQLGKVGLVPVIPDLTKREYLKFGAQREYLVHLVEREVDHMRPGIWNRDQQAFFDKIAQRLAQRPPADAKGQRHFRFDDLCAGRQHAAYDRGTQRLDDLFPERAPCKLPKTALFRWHFHQTSIPNRVPKFCSTSTLPNRICTGLTNFC